MIPALGALQKALAGIRVLAAAEIFRVIGVFGLQRRLESICEDFRSRRVRAT